MGSSDEGDQILTEAFCPCQCFPDEFKIEGITLEAQDVRTVLSEDRIQLTNIDVFLDTIQDDDFMPSSDCRGELTQPQGGLDMVTQIVRLDQQYFHQSMNRYLIRAIMAPTPCLQEIFFPSS